MGDGGFWERTERVATETQCWVIPHMSAAILLKLTTPLWAAAAWGETIALSPGGILPCPVVLKPDYWVQSDQINNWRSQPQTVDHRKSLTGCLRPDKVTIWLPQKWIQKEKTVVNTRGYRDEIHCGLLHDLRYFISCIAFAHSFVVQQVCAY